ncbi:MAG TPA: TetR family transcriptional regulator C-terminal domain-containing protein [Chitinophagales bacterium]|nr:TetR family transcriptional regulator C-terminal domain-containing protein [Chitinophagales bacterium]
MTAAEITQNYINYVVKHPKKKHTLFRFATTMGIATETIQQHFTTAKAIEQQIWGIFFDQTLKQLSADANLFENYSAREKMLAFFFTLEEVMGKHREFIAATYPVSWLTFSEPECLSDFKNRFLAFTNQLITQGLDTQEIAWRAILTGRYAGLIWLEVPAIIRFWVNDQSENFEKTDSLIEKTVNFTFDAMGHTVLDSGADLLKFLWATR